MCVLYFFHRSFFILVTVCMFCFLSPGCRLDSTGWHYSHAQIYAGATDWIDVERDWHVEVQWDTRHINESIKARWGYAEAGIIRWMKLSKGGMDVVKIWLIMIHASPIGVVPRRVLFGSCMLQLLHLHFISCFLFTFSTRPAPSWSLLLCRPCVLVIKILCTVLLWNNVSCWLDVLLLLYIVYYNCWLLAMCMFYDIYIMLVWEVKVGEKVILYL